MEYYSLEGQWNVRLADGTEAVMQLPGTLDENGIGHRDAGANQWHPDAALGNGENGFDADAPIATRFTRKYTYEGEARIFSKVKVLAKEFSDEILTDNENRVFLEAERARVLRLLVDGTEIPDYMEPSISTPHVFEVTGHLTPDSEITFLSDNSYPGLPRQEIVYSSAATDETQTNWNGILGYLRLRIEQETFISSVRVYPVKNTLRVICELDSPNGYTGVLTISSDALKNPVQKTVEIPAGVHSISFENVLLANSVRHWDEYEGNLYALSVEAENLDRKSVTFGIRDFGDDGHGRLAVNGRTIFLRSEANCAEFPESGHPSMTKGEWLEILNRYKAYGVNCMRFHSHTPPEAAFSAADEIGMLMQPELSHWNPKNAFETPDSFAYFTKEMRQILYSLANHPSFVMLTWGNELWTGEDGHRKMSEMLKLARSMDSTRLYANGSNVHYGTIGCDADSDFYAAQQYYEMPLRGIFAAMDPKERKLGGYINNQYPNTKTNYDNTMKAIRETYQKPVFGFEVGQFEVLPDFGELEDFHGISDPVNLRLILDRVRERGLEKVWETYVEATGELSRIGYREEIEAAMRTEHFSGISLLGLQDFPGQGTALVGMLNSHLRPKPYDFAKPERFHAFFREQLPLVEMDRYTYENTEVLHARIRMANFGKTNLEGTVRWTLTDSRSEIFMDGELETVCCPIGQISDAGRLEIPLCEAVHTGRMEIPLCETVDADTGHAAKLELTVSLDGAVNRYPIWV